MRIKQPEVDILEVRETSDSNPLTSVLCAAYQGSAYPNCGGTSGNRNGCDYTTGPDLTAGYHTYGCDWEPTGYTFYFDGVAMGSTTNGGQTQ